MPLLNKFLVGADPEFALLHKVNGQKAHAMRYIVATKAISLDHGGRIAEIHPEPAKGIGTLLRRIQGIVRSPTLLRLGNVKLKAGGMAPGDTLGGHVHIDVPCVNPNTGARTLDVLEKATALDWLTKLLEHLDILPQNESTTRRGFAYGGELLYGQFGDVRDSNGHTEYRTMASWLYDPKVAFTCLTTAKLAAVDPKGTIEKLKNKTSFEALRSWVEDYHTKDSNALRLMDVMEPGVKEVQGDPTVDIREAWEHLGMGLKDSVADPVLCEEPVNAPVPQPPPAQPVGNNLWVQNAVMHANAILGAQGQGRPNVEGAPPPVMPIQWAGGNVYRDAQGREVHHNPFTGGWELV